MSACTPCTPYNNFTVGTVDLAVAGSMDPGWKSDAVRAAARLGVCSLDPPECEIVAGTAAIGLGLIFLNELSGGALFRSREASHHHAIGTGLLSETRGGFTSGRVAQSPKRQLLRDQRR